MEQLIVTRKDGTTVDLFQSGSVWVEKGNQKKTLMSEDTVTLSVAADKELGIGIGSTVTIFGTRYKINQEPTVEKLASNRYNYELVFEAPFYDLVDIMYLNCDELKTSFPGSFSLTANLRGFLDVLINNCNRALGAGVWVLGTCPATETTTQSFASENCLSVLQKLCGADVYKQEFDVTYTAGVFTLNVRKQGRLHAETYSYGEGNGLYSLKRLKSSTTGLCNRMFVMGSERNIPAGYRNYSPRLLLANNALSVLEDSASIAQYGLKENFKTYDDIYPMREGTVTALGSDVFTFADSSMSFDLNEKDTAGNTKYLVAGTAAKVHVNSGSLAGYEFDLVSYTHSTKTFVLKKYTDERGQVFPSAGAFELAVGDKYVLLDINLPQAYIDDAEARLLAAATADFANSKPGKGSYELPVSELYMRQIIADPTTDYFVVGDSIPVQDTELGIDQAVRLQSFNRDVLNPFVYNDITLSDDVTITRVERLIQSQKMVERVVAMNSLNDPARSRRASKTVDELLNMTFDADGYFTDKIKPLSIETNLLSVGSRAGNLTLSSEVVANFGNDKTKVLITAGELTHLQIEENIRIWAMPQLLQPALEDANAYYLYAKCPRVGSIGAFVVDTAVYKVAEEADYYWFPIGVLSSVMDGYRTVSMTYGSAAIYGRSIKAGQIVNSSGKKLIDIDKAEIYGAMTFKSAEGDEVNVSDAINDVAANVSYKVEIISSNGTSFRNDVIATTFTAKVYKGSEDITATLNQGAFTWKRKSANTAADAIWNAQHATFYSNVLNITGDDVDERAVFNCEVNI